MKIFHFSDSHVWFSFENTAREDDFYTNFIRIIDTICTQKPDIVIHTGDLFHSPKPSNKAISIVVDQFLRLQKESIPVIIIAGNHDSPRLSTTTHPFEIFESFENFHFFYESKISAIELKNINFVILPHMHDQGVFQEEFLKATQLQKADMPNIFLSHFGISAQEYDHYTDEISGINISLTQLKILKSFDYVALGHYHKQFCIGNMCYPWSGEHTSFKQKNYHIGYNVFDTHSRKVEMYQLSTRLMIELTIDAKNAKTTDQLLEDLLKKYEDSHFLWAMVKIILQNIGKELFLELDEKKLLSFFADAFYIELRKIPNQNLQESESHCYQSSENFAKNFEIFFENYQKTVELSDPETLKKNIHTLLADL